MPANTVFSPTNVNQFQSDNVHFCGIGILGTAAHGAVTNIDLKLSDDMLIIGGMLNTKSASWGDYVNLKVVDVDNVLGYGAGAMLNQFASNWYCCDDSNGQHQILLQVPYPAKIFAGLYLRVEYHSTGAVDVGVNMNYLLHKVLY